MRLVTSCVRLACDVELLSNHRLLFPNAFFGLGNDRQPSYWNAANAIHRTLNHRPDRGAHLLMFGEE